MLQITQSQINALSSFKEFLESDSQVFMLKGAAGTGKTTLVSEFLKILDEGNREYGLMAPTGRAAYIIGGKTGKLATTIHRAIYGLTTLKTTRQNKDDEGDGGLHLRFALKNNEDSKNATYIVDESSMVSDAFSENEAFFFGSGCLLTDLFEYARGRKIVLIGDYAQLPPVGMNFSPALDKEYIEKNFGCEVREVVLREVIRQSTDGVMLSNATRIRNNIEQKSFIEFRLEEGEDSKVEDLDLLSQYFQISPIKPDVRSAIIAYSNRQALDYNIAVRRHYYGESAPRLKPGDLLMICRNNYSYEHELFNGNIVQVESCQPDNEIIERHVRVKSGRDKIETVDLRFRKVTIRFGVNGKPGSLNVMLLDNFLDDPNGSVGGLLARALIVDFNNRLPENIKSRYNEIRRLLRSKDKLTIAQQELCETYVKLLNKDPYYNAVICKYGYAMTCHKAQGGEWDTVFVDMCRYGGTANEDYFRWAYTALTRASKRLWHYRSPDFNYISNLVVEPIQQSGNIKVSIFAGVGDYIESRFHRIKSLCDKSGITVKEDKSCQYQHRLTFNGSNNEQAEYTLWYNAKGYSGKDILQQTSSSDFALLCKQIIDDSLAPEGISFTAPSRPFAEKLVNFVKSQIEELGIQLLNITQEHYQDVFHLKTDGLAKVALFYTDKGNYTYMRLQSSLGSEDQKLEALRQRFI